MPAPEEHDAALCIEHRSHRTSRRHRREDCPAEQYEGSDTEREAEEEFMRQYPGVL